MGVEEKVREIKKEFFAYRNGILADRLRDAGYPYRIIFGLNVPQLAELARLCGYDMDLADALWSDRGVRESRLLACYLFDPEKIDAEEAFRLACDVATEEEADMLSFRLLKRLPYVSDLYGRLSGSDSENAFLAARSLARHLE